MQKYRNNIKITFQLFAEYFVSTLSLGAVKATNSMSMV